jgi:lipopolysaccharide/colanic/teichoic acid biosynthesis glycosyltransferase
MPLKQETQFPPQVSSEDSVLPSASILETFPSRIPATWADGEFDLFNLREKQIRTDVGPPWALACKRALDIAVSGFLILLALPFSLVVALCIKLTSRGPVLYCSNRVGRNGKLFELYKFRTMVAHAEVLKKDVEHLNERDRVLFKIENDPRLTSIGALLRKFSVDEIPQLWNVLMGDMSLVGPRPSMVEECFQYSETEFHRLAVNPGITGLWQVTARRDPSFERYIELDLKYIEDWSLMLDLKILLRTIPEVICGSGM